MRALALTAAILCGCSTLAPLRAADGRQAASGGEEARLEVAGVKLVVRADGWRSWPERYMQQLTPVEVRVVNDGPVALEVHPHQFALEREGQKPLVALEAGDLPKVMRFDGPPDRDLSFYAGLSGPLYPGNGTPVASSHGVYPYDWRGLTNADAAARPVSAHGPDPRPYPSGVLGPGQAAAFMLFFDTPADRTQAFTIVASLAGEGGAPLGEARVPFRR